jgi:type IV secretory pathway VirB3-like protein
VLIAGTILGLPLSAAIAVLMVLAVVFVIVRFLTPGL